jgi:hypothetical protein
MKKLFLVTLLGAALSAVASLSPRAAFAASDWAVTVECWSQTNCNNTTLGGICGSGNSAVSVSCGQVVTPSSSSNCGSGASCSQHSSSGGYNARTIGEFCQDISGWDAIVYCHSPF